MRPGAGRRTEGPGEGIPAGGDCAPAPAGEVCLREAAGGSFSAHCKLGGRGRAGRGAGHCEQAAVLGGWVSVPREDGEAPPAPGAARDH